MSYIGETEESLIRKGTDYVAGRGNYDKNPRGQILGESGGMLKLVFERPSLRLVGAHVVGSAASEIIHVGGAFLRAGATANDIAETLYNYLILSDMYRHAALKALGEDPEARAGRANPATLELAAIAKEGVAASRMSAVGWGQEKPVADNRTEAGRAEDRRGAGEEIAAGRTPLSPGPAQDAPGRASVMRPVHDELAVHRHVRHALAVLQGIREGRPSRMVAGSKTTRSAASPAARRRGPGDACAGPAVKSSCGPLPRA